MRDRCRARRQLRGFLLDTLDLDCSCTSQPPSSAAFQKLRNFKFKGWSVEKQLLMADNL